MRQSERDQGVRPGQTTDERERIKALNREIAAFVVGHLIDEVEAGFARFPDVLQHLAAVRAERQELIRIWRAGEISDEVLHAFAVVGEPAAVGRGLVERWGDIATRLTLYAPFAHDRAVWPEVMAAMR